MSSLFSYLYTCRAAIKSGTFFVNDGWGDGITSSCLLHNCKSGENKYIDKSHVTIKDHKAFSIAELYADVTHYLGFKRNCDEGRVEALAAFGEVIETIFSWIISEFKSFPSSLTIHEDNAHKFHPSKLDSVFSEYSREDIAATTQAALEHLILGYVKHHCNKLNVYDVVVSGGVHANVTLNNKILNSYHHAEAVFTSLPSWAMKGHA